MPKAPPHEVRIIGGLWKRTPLSVPDLPGLAESGFVTSDTLWETFAELDTMPRRIVVLGGGPIGCELAQAFARLGAEVTQVDRGARLLAREDEEVSELVRTAQQQAAPASKDDIMKTLKDLADLKNAGVLTEEEFAAKKAELLAKL